MEWLKDKVALVGQIDPQAAGTTTATTDVIDTRYFEQVLFIVQVGTALATADIDFVVRKSTATAAGTTTASGGVASITQLEGTADKQKQAIVNVRTADLGSAYRYIKGVLTTATANSACAVTALGYPGRYQPAYDYDLASVDEIVTS